MRSDAWALVSSRSMLTRAIRAVSRTLRKAASRWAVNSVSSAIAENTTTGTRIAAAIKASQARTRIGFTSSRLAAG